VNREEFEIQEFVPRHAKDQKCYINQVRKRKMLTFVAAIVELGVLVLEEQKISHDPLSA
jgi:hypothetical protein